jgi:hypothetical protein
VLNSESIVIIRIKGEYLLYSKVSGRKVYYIANISRGSKHSGGRFAMRKVYYTTPEQFQMSNEKSQRGEKQQQHKN